MGPYFITKILTSPTNFLFQMNLEDHLFSVPEGTTERFTGTALN